MKTFLTAIILTLSFNLLADEYVYFSFDTFSDDGGEFKHELFKAQIGEGQFGMYCDLVIKILDKNNNETEAYGYQIESSKEDNLYVASILASSDSNEEEYYSAANFSDDLDHLFTYYSNGDGYVMEGIGAGSFNKVKFSLEMMDDGEIVIKEQDFKDVTSEEVNKILSEDQYSKTTLMVSCGYLE